MARRVAVVLFNLGGPDSPAAIQPFLQNLFSDPAILDVPGPLRWILARVISRRRAPVARQIYAELGGRSPLMPETEAQARALEAELDELGEVKVFIAMRYWHPFAAETVAEVKAFAPDEVVLMPLYPQFSTTTSASSVADWRRAAKSAGLDAPIRAVCCYPRQRDFVGAHVEGLAEVLAAGPARILFSAHGLPQKVVDGGDPYQWQVEQTAAAVIEALQARLGHAAIDHVVCYQSRVGPLKWLEPSTEAEIARAGKEGTAIIVVPIAFVSEHSETLVELDIEYRQLADAAGVPRYDRIPALGVSAGFVSALGALVRAALKGEDLISEAGGRICPVRFGRCPQAEAETGP